MKKLLYFLLIVFSCSLIMTACTEEEIKPNNESLGASGGVGDDKIKDK